MLRKMVQRKKDAIFKEIWVTQYQMVAWWLEEEYFEVMKSAIAIGYEYNYKIRRYVIGIQPIVCRS